MFSEFHGVPLIDLGRKTRFVGSKLKAECRAESWERASCDAGGESCLSRSSASPDSAGHVTAPVATGDGDSRVAFSNKTSELFSLL